MWRRMSNVSGDLISIAGFFAKEVIVVLRQPRLLLSLVLGPFLIMVLFGLGYRGPHPEFRTILVVPPDPAIAERVDVSDVYRAGLSGVFKLEKVMHDQELALAELRADRADVVVVVPDDLFQQISSGNQAALQVYYTETDPTSNAWVRYFTSVQAGELNRRLLLHILRQTKDPVLQTLAYTDQVLTATDRIEADLQAGDYQSASAHIDRLLRETAESEESPNSLGERLDTLTGAFGEGSGEPGEARRLLVETAQELRELRSDLAGGSVDPSSALDRVQRIRANVKRVHAIASQVSKVPAEVLVSPLTAQALNVAPVEPSPVAFYAPAVLALLLQHIGVTLSSLSAVRDRVLGSLELFRVSPVGATHILIGKSLGFGLLLAVVSLALTTALTRFLGVPLLGSLSFYWLTVGLVIFAAVGLGFALSVIAANESQAVQLSMLVLLTSVFFGGFFLPTTLLFPWVRAVTYLLPVSYGASNLRDLMLRGAIPPWPLLLGPLVLGLVFYGFAMLGLRRQIRRARGKHRVKAAPAAADAAK